MSDWGGCYGTYCVDDRAIVKFYFENYDEVIMVFVMNRISTMGLRRQFPQEWEPTPRTFFENGWNPAGEARQRYSILQLCSAEAENPEQNIFYCSIAEEDSLISYQ